MVSGKSAPAVMLVSALAAALVLSACQGSTTRPQAGQPGTDQPRTDQPGATASGTSEPRSSPETSTEPSPETSTGPPTGPFTGTLRTADVLITASGSIGAKLREKVRRIPHVTAVEPLSVGAVSVQGRTLTIAAVGDGYRRFTPYQTANAGQVWQRLAAGEAAVDGSVPRRITPMVNSRSPTPTAPRPSRSGLMLR